VAALVALGRQVAAHFGAPQDIEWALARGRLWLVQSRPITSLFPLPQPEPPPEAGLRVYISGNTVQGVLEPITPMGLAVFRILAGAIATLLGSRPRPGEAPPVFKTAAGRFFMDFTPVLRHPKARLAPLRGL